MRQKHMLLMLACCLIPLVGLGAILALGVSVNSVVFFGMLLVCPLLHFVMMRGMMGGHGHHEEQQVEAVKPRVAEPPEEILPRQTGV